MSNELLLKNYVAGGAVAKHRIVKFGAADGIVVTGAAATDALIGINAELDVAQGERVDVIRAGLPLVEYGGNVTRGAPLTSDATGRAITAAPAAGSNVRIVGFAEVNAVAGDIDRMLFAPGVMQG